MKLFCNLPQTEINFRNSKNERITVKFHAGIFETEDEETINFLSGYQNQGVMVSITGGEVDVPMEPVVEEDKIDYTPVFPDDEPEPITKTKSKGKR